MSRKEVLKDYIRWRGDLSFEQVPLNEVDSAVLCELSYVDYSNVLEPMNPIGPTFQETYQKITEKNCYRLLTAQGGQEDFIQAAAASKRFGSLSLIRSTDVLDVKSTQFSAVTFRLGPETDFIAFRGTDNSIIGWREDFTMSFSRIPAQDLAEKYLRFIMKPDRKFYIGGHSKGGNLAVYAASKLQEDLRGRILGIFALDAPGFSPDVYDMNAIQAVDHLVTSVIPTFDVIGQLFPWKQNHSILINSVQNGILQHDLVSWRVDGPQFSRAEKIDPRAELINGTLREWLNRMDKDRRKIFVTELFESLSAGGAETLEGISESSSISEVVRAMTKISPAAKEAAMDLPRSAWNTSHKMLDELVGQISRREKKQAAEKLDLGKKK